MEQRLLRTAAVLVVTAAAGGVALRYRAGEVARRTAAARHARDSLAAASAAANPESVTVVTAAIAAYDAERQSRRAAPLTVRVLAYERARAGVIVTLIPERLVEGGGAVVLVDGEGQATVLSHDP